MSEESRNGADKQRLFWGCFVALVATSFGFMIRIQVMAQWATDFNLSETQKGEIFGAGLWPFGISIVLFSLFIDKVGYGTAMVFAFICHVASAAVAIFCPGKFDTYWSLYASQVIVALGNGTVEAVINPVVASMYTKEKTKWLNILHAGWPGGFVIAGILIFFMGEAPWAYKVALILLPTIVYAVMLLGCKFPVQERVAAGVSYRDMLGEAGILGMFIVTFLIVSELTNIFAGAAMGDLGVWARHGVNAGIAAVLLIPFGVYVRGSLGRPLFVLMLLIMIPLATTELGTDSWITDLTSSELKRLGVAAVWMLVLTQTIMMILRFCAGGIVHRVQPLGLLAISSAIAVMGLFWLANAAGVVLLVAAAVYACGKTFFWPTMLGVVAERFPRGGALTLNATGGVGMLGVGIIGAVFLGYFQDVQIDKQLKKEPALHRELVTKEKTSVIGKYTALDGALVSAINDKVALYEKAEEAKKKNAGLDDAALAAKMAEDRTYQKLVLDCFEHAAAGEKDRPKTDTHEARVAFLKRKGYFVTADDYSTLKAKKTSVDTATGSAKKGALATVTVFPIIMVIAYVLMILYFRATGGYKAVDLAGESGKSGESGDKG